MKNTNRNLARVQYLTRLSILAALTVILTLVSLKIGLLEITFATIPVVVGAVTLGPLGGLILGTVFGLTSFMMCFGLSLFGATMLAINPFFMFVVCVPTRMLTGWLVAVLYRGIRPLDRSAHVMRKNVAISVASFSGPVLNTLFFMSALIGLFIFSAPIQKFYPADGSFSSIISLFAALAGVNAIVEAIACTILSGAVLLALVRIFPENSR